MECSRPFVPVRVHTQVWSTCKIVVVYQRSGTWIEIPAGKDSEHETDIHELNLVQ
jgi:hypothetical protein